MKKITLKNYEIQNIITLLSAQDSIINNRSENKMPILLLWNIDKNFEKLSKINKDIADMRKNIEQGYMDDKYSYDNLDEDGNLIGRQIKQEYIPEFIQKINELMSLDNEVDIATIPLSKLDDFSVDGVTLQSIKFMIDDDTEKADVLEGTIE